MKTQFVAALPVLHAYLEYRGQAPLDESPDFRFIRYLLDACPLPADEYGLAKLELQHATDYTACGEAGAARYQLRLLQGRVTKNSRRLGD